MNALSRNRSHTILPGDEPIDKTGTVGSLHLPGIAADRLGRQSLSNSASVDCGENTIKVLINARSEF
jgi:hypothetical protein